MSKRRDFKRTILLFVGVFFGMFGNVHAGECSQKLFSVTIDDQLEIRDVIENLADSCSLTINITDEEAKKKMQKKLYYVKLKNSTLETFLDTILTDNDLYYTLQGNKLSISYLVTKTYKIHYLSGDRTGKSSANVTVANANSSSGTAGGSGGSGGGSGASGQTGISIETNNAFNFWQTVGKEIQDILSRAGDDWESDKYAPIVNPEAGMVTVTGTQRQIKRVSAYIKAISEQLKSQVLIDVRILSVDFDDSQSTGVDWSQLYKFENMKIGTLTMAQNNVDSFTFDAVSGAISAATFADEVSPKNASVVNLSGATEITEVVKFLTTQGDVKTISSPRVMTLNNQPALLSVGREYFYKIKSSSTTTNGASAVAAEGEQVQSVFAGILLDITPEISSDGFVTLKINPSISETVDTISSGTDVRSIPPDLVKQQIASVIKVKDGDHAILGGLIKAKSGFKTNKIPLLGDLPLLEYLFKYENKIKTVEELVIIITPHIIENSKSLSLTDLGYTKLDEK